MDKLEMLLRTVPCIDIGNPMSEPFIHVSLRDANGTPEGTFAPDMPEHLPLPASCFYNIYMSYKYDEDGGVLRMPPGQFRIKRFELNELERLVDYIGNEYRRLY